MEDVVFLIFSVANITYHMQAGQAVDAGYFGGYSAKMQDIGDKELQRLREALDRKVESSAQDAPPQAFQKYSKRLLKDLEAKGILGTAVESLNLSVHAAHADVLMVECMCASPTVTFRASVLLKREEVGTLEIPGQSIIAAAFRGKGEGRKTFTEAPNDLLYTIIFFIKQMDYHHRLFGAPRGPLGPWWLRNPMVVKACAHGT